MPDREVHEAVESDEFDDDLDELMSAESNSQYIAEKRDQEDEQGEEGEEASESREIQEALEADEDLNDDDVQNIVDALAEAGDSQEEQNKIAELISGLANSDNEHADKAMAEISSDLEGLPSAVFGEEESDETNQGQQQEGDNPEEENQEGNESDGMTWVHASGSWGSVLYEVYDLNENQLQFVEQLADLSAKAVEEVEDADTEVLEREQATEFYNELDFEQDNVQFRQVEFEEFSDQSEEILGVEVESVVEQMAQENIPQLHEPPGNDSDELNPDMPDQPESGEGEDPPEDDVLYIDIDPDHRQLQRVQNFLNDNPNEFDRAGFDVGPEGIFGVSGVDIDFRERLRGKIDEFGIDTSKVDIQPDDLNPDPQE